MSDMTLSRRLKRAVCDAMSGGAPADFEALASVEAMVNAAERLARAAIRQTLPDGVKPLDGPGSPEHDDAEFDRAIEEWLDATDE